MFNLGTTHMRPQRQSLMLKTILLLFFFQLITEFVEAIYIFGLLGTSIPNEIVMVLLFLAPVLLFAFGKRVHPRWIQAFATLTILARAIEITLSTRGRMIVSGIGVAAFLMYVPSLLARPRSSEAQKRLAREAGYGLTLAVFASILSRALLSGSDLTAHGMFRLLTWGLAAAALYLLFRTQPAGAIPPNLTQDRPVPAKNYRVYAYALGIVSVIILLYFAFTAPNIIARWGDIPKISVFSLLMLAWVSVGWWWLQRETIPSILIIGWGFVFVLAILFAILPHQITFTPIPDVNNILPEPSIATWQYIPLYLMLVLSPVLALAFVSHLEGLLADQPKLGTLAGAFGVAGFYILIMVFSQVFTTVYDYIPAIGPFFRNKYWLAFLVPSLGAILPALLLSSKQNNVKVFSLATRRGWLVTAVLMSIVALIGLSALEARPGAPGGETSGTLRVFTYNIQQGYSEYGERNFDGQIDLIRSKAPDILGLQECDTARIAGGNTDVVAYFADRLNMHSYYGPSPVAGTFGVALISRYPIEDPRTYYLHSAGEQVAVIEADITVGDQTYRVYVTHLGNGGPIIQIRQMLKLMRGQENVIAMGDYNFRHYEEQYSLTTTEYEDAYLQADQKNIPPDFDLEERIDHIFVSPGMSVGYVEYLTQPESDHPALFVEIKQ
jgi:endonuclease/exonuclease/phosphatase family metal-dependent hydrolase